MEELTQEQAKLLNDIMKDKFARGAFSGMIYNQYMQSKDSIQECIVKALETRLLLQKLSDKYDDENETI